MAKQLVGGYEKLVFILTFMGEQMLPEVTYATRAEAIHARNYHLPKWQQYIEVDVKWVPL